MVGAAPVYFLGLPLGAFLRRVAGDGDLAEFWVRYASTILVIVPVAFAVLVDGYWIGEGKTLSSALRAALAGEILALALIGLALRAGARRDRVAECRAIALGAPPAE